MIRKYYRCVTPEIAHAASKAVIEAFNSKDKTIEVIIQEYKKNRSKSQNRYYWAILKLISNFFGYTDKEMHEYFKSEFLQQKESLVFDEQVKIYPSTRKLNTSEFSEYVELITRFCADQGFAVPTPFLLGYEL